MAAPQIFLSSTCYDLSSVRSSLEQFLGGYGFAVLNSESKKFGVTPKSHSHDACLDQVKYADYLVLIIGGRRGGNYIGSESSITNEEFHLAQKLGIPVLAFVDKAVYGQLRTYRKNPQADFSHVVDDVRIFDFVSYVASGHEDNWLHEFTSAVDIEETLRAQFAYYLKLFSESMRPGAKPEADEKVAAVAFPAKLDNIPSEYTGQEEITEFRDGLFKVHSILSSILSSATNRSSKEEKLKTLWILARYGEFNGSCIKLNADIFRDYAWGTTKGRRVFNQLEEFGVSCSYESDYDKNDEPANFVYITVTGVENSEFALSALQELVSALLDKNDEKAALELFKRADVRVFS